MKKKSMEKNYDCKIARSSANAYGNDVLLPRIKTLIRGLTFTLFIAYFSSTIQAAVWNDVAVANNKLHPPKKYQVMVIATLTSADASDDDAKKQSTQKKTTQLKQQLVENSYQLSKVILEYMPLNDKYFQSLLLKNASKKQIETTLLNFSTTRFTFCFFIGKFSFDDATKTLWYHTAPINTKESGPSKQANKLRLSSLSTPNNNLFYAFFIPIRQLNPAERSAEKSLSSSRSKAAFTYKLPYGSAWINDLNALTNAIALLYQEKPNQKYDWKTPYYTIGNLLKRVKTNPPPHLTQALSTNIILREFKWQSTSVITNNTIFPVFRYSTNSTQQFNTLTKNFIAYTIKLPLKITKEKIGTKSIITTITNRGTWIEYSAKTNLN